MSNLTKRQRVTPSPGAPSAKPRQPGSRVLTPDQKKAQQELLHWWTLLKALGVPLDAQAMSLRGGYSKGHASQYLHGHIALNTDAMLWFSREMKMAPQEIWSDWRWSDITSSPSLVSLYQHWIRLDVVTRDAVHKLIRLDGHLRLDPSGALHILPGAPRGALSI